MSIVRRGSLLFLVPASQLLAQDLLLPSTGWGMGVGVSAWSLATPLPQAGGSILGVAEVAVPMRLTTTFAGRWKVDVSGAWASGGALVESPDGSGGELRRFISMQGPTDVKVRVTGPLVGERMFLTGAVNLPTGRTGLGLDETLALQSLAAPAFRMPVAAFGSGLGYTLGAIQAFDRGDWALALGASVEQRTEYTPVALALSGGTAETSIAPGSAVHVTAAVDRPLGSSVWSFMVIGDVFSTDRVTSPASGGPALEYRLGPQVTATTQLRLGGGSWRSGYVAITGQRRAEFSDSAGMAVAGSGSTLLEASLGGVRGAEGSTGTIVGLDVRRLSGLSFTDALVGLAATTAGVTLGLEMPRAGSVMRVVLRGQMGSFDTGTTSTSGVGVSLGITVASRGGPR